MINFKNHVSPTLVYLILTRTRWEVTRLKSKWTEKWTRKSVDETNLDSSSLEKSARSQ